MNPKVRKMLDKLDAFFVSPKNEDDDSAAQLWNILSALRGPDSDAVSVDVKSATTVYIRRTAFPRVAETSEFPMGAQFYVDKQPFAPSSIPREESHFRRHVLDAAVALDLVEDIRVAK